uniref:RING-type domain-containing protein n=1 Tax=Rhodosorus marinus TaxID=101924 RepID=A0A7S3EA25_9RHOD|mmetsp:Transcript_20090/g.80739  ORF Transcript_20090/g.80739 Transcript_20090/m.80739 type:complete len:312 (+) Transcript_20090:552-1487(+)
MLTEAESIGAAGVLMWSSELHPTWNRSVTVSTRDISSRIVASNELIESYPTQVSIPVAWTQPRFAHQAQKVFDRTGYVTVVLDSRGEELWNGTALTRVWQPIFSLVRYAIFAVTWATVMLLLANLCSFMYSRVREWFATRWRLRRINRLPFKQYAPGRTEEEEACVICLEDFQRGDKVNVFPCTHIFHRDCIITWLVESQLCPVCKRDVFGTPEEMECTVNVQEEGSEEVDTVEGTSVPEDDVPQGERRRRRSQYRFVQQEVDLENSESEGASEGTPEGNRRKRRDYVTVDIEDPDVEEEEVVVTSSVSTP